MQQKCGAKEGKDLQPFSSQSITDNEFQINVLWYEWVVESYSILLYGAGDIIRIKLSN